MIVAFLLAAILGNFVVQSTEQVKFVKGPVGTAGKTPGSKDEPKHANLLKLNATRKDPVFRNGSNGINMADESSIPYEYSTESSTELTSGSTMIPHEFLNVEIFGKISSQDYPNYDYGEQSLIWQLYSPNGQGVSIQFLSLNLQNGDYIQIFDQYHNLLTKYDSSGGLLDLTYPYQQNIFVNFYKYYYSNCPSSSNCGFVATYSLPFTTDVVAPYGSYFVSPGFPYNYQAGLDEVWKFRTQDAYCQYNCVQLDFQIFNLLENDFVTVYNGDGIDEYLASVYHVYTQYDTPGMIQSSNQALTLRFTTSNYNYNYQAGFSLYYNLGLGWLVSTTFSTTGITSTVSTSGPTTTGFPIINVAIFGSISSPNYPSNYDNNDHVEWLLSAPSEYTQISLQFLAFTTESSDFVRIYDQYSNQIASFSGSLIPFTVTYNFNFIRVVFESDGSYVNTGFLATYSLPISTDQTVAPYSSYFTSPGFPNNYQADLDNVWVFRTQNEYCQYNCVQFDFRTLYLLENDFVTVYDGDGVMASVYYVYTRNDFPGTIQSSNQALTLRFTTNNNNNNYPAGFSLYYYIGQASTTTATSEMTTTRGEPIINVAIFGNISSPNYPYNYDNNDHVEWLLSAPSEYTQISLQFLAFTTESSDFVRIYDQNSIQIASFSGNVTPFTATYDNNFIRVVFQSDNSNVYPGFLATYSLPISNTQYIDSGDNSLLQNPGYPGYQANLDTVWILKSNCQSCVYIVFEIFTLTNDGDFLTIYMGDSVLVNSYTTYSGSEIPFNFSLTSQSITFRFTTSQASSAGGFQLNYTIHEPSTNSPYRTIPVQTEPSAPTASYFPTYRLVTANGQTIYPFGRVEVAQTYYSQWGTICSNYWSNEDAKVVCRMMGYRSGNAVGIPNSAFGPGSGNIVMNDVRCSGSEENIFQCQYNADGYNCNHYQDASVICTDELVTNISPTDISMITCSGHGEPVCNCIPGYSGPHCESKIGNFCNDSVPDFPNTSTGQLCQPNGYCMESETQAVCICHYGYSGEFCQTQNPNQLWTADRCTVYETFQTEQQNVTLGCPPNQNCIPDHISCNVVNSCEMPLGWCLPQDEYDKYMRYVNQTLKA